MKTDPINFISQRHNLKSKNKKLILQRNIKKSQNRFGISEISYDNLRFSTNNIVSQQKTLWDSTPLTFRQKNVSPEKFNVKLINAFIALKERNLKSSLESVNSPVPKKFQNLGKNHSFDNQKLKRVKKASDIWCGNNNEADAVLNVKRTRSEQISESTFGYDDDDDDEIVPEINKINNFTRTNEFFSIRNRKDLTEPFQIIVNGTSNEHLADGNDISLMSEFTNINPGECIKVKKNRSGSQDSKTNLASNFELDNQEVYNFIDVLLKNLKMTETFDRISKIENVINTLSKDIEVIKRKIDDWNKDTQNNLKPNYGIIRSSSCEDMNDSTYNIPNYLNLDNKKLKIVSNVSSKSSKSLSKDSLNDEELKLNKNVSVKNNPNGSNSSKPKNIESIDKETLSDSNISNIDSSSHLIEEIIHKYSNGASNNLKTFDNTSLKENQLAQMEISDNNSLPEDIPEDCNNTVNEISELCLDNKNTILPLASKDLKNIFADIFNVDPFTAEKLINLKNTQDPYDDGFDNVMIHSIKKVTKKTKVINVTETRCFVPNIVEVIKISSKGHIERDNMCEKKSAHYKEESEMCLENPDLQVLQDRLTYGHHSFPNFNDNANNNVDNFSKKLNTSISKLNSVSFSYGSLALEKIMIENEQICYSTALNSTVSHIISMSQMSEESYLIKRNIPHSNSQESIYYSASEGLPILIAKNSRNYESTFFEGIESLFVPRRSSIKIELDPEANSSLSNPRIVKNKKFDEISDENTLSNKYLFSHWSEDARCEEESKFDDSVNITSIDYNSGVLVGNKSNSKAFNVMISEKDRRMNSMYSILPKLQGNILKKESAKRKKKTNFEYGTIQFTLINYFDIHLSISSILTLDDSFLMLGTLKGMKLIYNDIINSLHRIVFTELLHCFPSSQNLYNNSIKAVQDHRNFDLLGDIFLNPVITNDSLDPLSNEIITFSSQYKSYNEYLFNNDVTSSSDSFVDRNIRTFNLKKFNSLYTSFEEIDCETQCSDIIYQFLNTAYAIEKSESDSETRFLTLVTKLTQHESILMRKSRMKKYLSLAVRKQPQGFRILGKKNSSIKMAHFSIKIKLKDKYKTFREISMARYSKGPSKFPKEYHQFFAKRKTKFRSLQESTNVIYPKIVLHDSYGFAVSNKEYNLKSPMHNTESSTLEPIDNHFCHVCARCGQHFAMISQLRNHSRIH